MSEFKFSDRWQSVLLRFGPYIDFDALRLVAIECCKEVLETYPDHFEDDVPDRVQEFEDGLYPTLPNIYDLRSSFAREFRRLYAEHRRDAKFNEAVALASRYFFENGYWTEQ